MKLAWGQRSSISNSFPLLNPAALTWASHITICATHYIVPREGEGWHTEAAQVGLTQKKKMLEMNKPSKTNNTIESLLAHLYLYNSIIPASMCEGIGWLVHFTRLHSGEIGCGSDACWFLMINEFPCSHSWTMVRDVCQTKSAVLAAGFTWNLEEKKKEKSPVVKRQKYKKKKIFVELEKTLFANYSLKAILKAACA